MAQPSTDNPVEAYPFVALTIQATGIHPSTGRLLTLDAVTFNDEGAIGEEFHCVFNPGGDAGPRHNHGLEPSDFAQAPRFARHLKALDRLVDKRTLVLHDAPLAWGFIVSEARRAMTAAARANRSRAERGGKRRRRVGHIPRPCGIVDTLAAARRHGVIPLDTRPAALARALGLPADDPTASVQRAARTEEETSRERTLMVLSLFFALRAAGPVAQLAPDDLAADRFGLQRSALRVDAENDAQGTPNPGVYTPDRGLAPGMEIVVTDDIAVDPDEVIALALDAGLNYSEKLTRQTSLVVSDAVAQGAALRGKAMHAARKQIPVLSADQFQRAVARTG
ncbi:DNA polymerase III subunit epsilon [Corynebacterium liangguodongii]|uniref:DNA polymerase III subunit epsilon n=1 Tax=Corynebacterium liangguodongii TaxID=2079535 RepID=A0A2S0WBQ8_9CORY|nr:DNA polymerase III subunit epsilon [Corynebacterium liangguodongii]AWB83197.1 DNA polymerase III subunit epsilon [Corynebacterium liangguodongii]PWB98792.1 DNA polymerase III subunit epsilon [Corynebacterium liangguodongii]